MPKDKKRRSGRKRRNVAWPPPPKEFDNLLERDYDPRIFYDHVRFLCNIARKLRSKIEILEESIPDMDSAITGGAVLSQIWVIVNNACTRWDEGLGLTIRRIYGDRLKRGYQNRPAKCAKITRRTMTNNEFRIARARMFGHVKS